MQLKLMQFVDIVIGCSALALIYELHATSKFRDTQSTITINDSKLLVTLISPKMPASINANGASSVKKPAIKEHNDTSQE